MICCRRGTVAVPRVEGREAVETMNFDGAPASHAGRGEKNVASDGS